MAANASSSKRPATCSFSNSTHPNKQPKHSADFTKAESVAASEFGDEELDADGEAVAKNARKEARVIRNRESAQRSRNARKQHLVWLEARVIELEAENRALKGGSATPAPSTSSVFSSSCSSSVSRDRTPAQTCVTREPSPAQSVHSLANDLGLPSELVAGAGVKLSNVAPPSADLAIEMGMEIDVKPDISGEILCAVSERDDADDLKEENKTLKERCGLLENLVKQVVALSSLNGAPLISSFSDPKGVPLDTLLQSPGLEATLSPPLYQHTLLPDTTAETTNKSLLHPQSHTLPDTSSTFTVNTPPVACHSAVVGPAAGEGIKVFKTENAEDGIGAGQLGPGAGEEGGENVDIDTEVGEWDRSMEKLIEDLEGKNAMREERGISMDMSMGEWRATDGIAA